jgi:hypothetical protein
MRKVYLDMISDSSSRDDDYYYLVFDEDAAEIFVEHSWHYWSPREINQGSENITLAELKSISTNIYQKAVDIITALFPSRENERQMTNPLTNPNQLPQRPN